MRTIMSCALFLASLVTVADSDNLLKPTDKVESWRFEQAEGGKGEMKAGDKEIVFKVTDIDSTDWHVQAVQTDLVLANNKTYVIEFKAKASESRSIMVNAMIDQEDWHQIGLNEEANLTKEYKTFKYEFTASDVHEKKNRISFVLGGSKGTVSLQDVTLKAK